MASSEEALPLPFPTDFILARPTLFSFVNRGHYLVRLELSLSHAKLRVTGHGDNPEISHYFFSSTSRLFRYPFLAPLSQATTRTAKILESVLRE